MTKFSAPQQNQLAQIGAFLRENREKQEKSLEDIAIRTYIRPQLLNGLETGDPDVLPEPIFVQGFIRRYAETLGLNGVELSHQFTVDSIPSTPRPAKQAPLTDSATTRLTRVPAANGQAANGQAANGQSPTGHPASSQIANGQAAASDAVAPVFSPVAPETHASETAPIPEGNEALSETDARQGDEPFTVSDVPLETYTEPPETAENFFDGEIAVPESGDDLTIESGTPDDGEDIAFNGGADVFNVGGNEGNGNYTSQPGTDTTAGRSSEALTDASSTSFNNGIASSSTASDSEGSFASPAQFNDDLPSAFTTEAQPTRQSEPAQASRAVRPVGVELSRDSSSPNLKPLIFGAIAGLVAVVAVILFSVFGGGERKPGVADNPDTIEQSAGETAAEPDVLPAVPDAPATAATPDEPETPASTAPVYVEAKATSETWVSIIADGNPIFEGTLQPGDTQVWEAQDNLSIYSGDPGALTLAVNGGDAAVMGEPGQPEEKIFSPE